MTGDRVTKAQARAAIREAREALRDLETALRQAGPTRDYVMGDDEMVARLGMALETTRDALGRNGDDD